ncbi:MAG: hypothetical protein ACT4PV_09740 [Planctomycetaceae bacterium]
MSEWLKLLLGVEDKEIPEGAQTAFEFARLPRGAAALALLLLLAAVVAAVIWIYRREGSAAPRVKFTLATLRSLVLLSLVLLLLEPVLAVDQVETIQKSTLVLLDESLSMSTQDRYKDPQARARLKAAFDVEPGTLTRAALLDRALRNSGLLAMLARQNPVLVYRFADEATLLGALPQGAGAAEALPPLDPAARARGAKGTDLAGAVRQAVELAGSDRVAAVILLTDGRSNLGAPPEDAALYLRNKDLRLFTVPVGEAVLLPNLRAVALAGPDRIFRKDPAVFEAKVSGRGIGAAEVLFERRYEGETDWERVSTQTAGFAEGEGVVPLSFTDRPPRMGTLQYRVRLLPDPEETNTSDNEKVFDSSVIDEKAMALLVSGAPAHEYYAIKNVLLRDPTITLACFLQSADDEFAQDGNISLEALPSEEAGLFKFDVVILHDPDGVRLPPGWPALLKRFVGTHGGGLAYIAGEQHTLGLLRREGGVEIADLLPVVLDLDRADSPEFGIGFGRQATEPWRMVPEPAGLTHPATRFNADANRARELVWERLPQFYWFFPVLKEKPGALILARHEDPRQSVEPYGRRPILAVHRYGAGNVLFLAADETFRWRAVAESVFDRFWVQTARFLVEGRLQGERRRFRIHLDTEALDLGDSVHITAEAFDEAFRPLDAPSVRAILTQPGGKEEEIVLLPAEGKPGSFAGSYAPPAVGDYEVRGTERTGKPAGASFTVSLPDREMGDVRADAPLLADLARRARGFSPALHEVARLGDPALIPPATERVVTSGRPVPLWDTWTSVIVVLLLLCAEWILRKRFRMV